MELEIHAFLDSEEKELGDSFPSTIENAIRSASAHIAIFSKRYAESPWCLAELVLMLESRAKVIPLFYGVEPSALRYIESGDYAKAFTKYEEKGRYNMEKLNEWKKALHSVSFLTGHEISSNYNDYQNIVSAVQKEVKRKKTLHVAKYPVGLQSIVKDFERRCLDQLVEDFERHCRTKEGGKEKAQIVGIFGMGGVGKTTLAKELFNRKRSEYTEACFLFHVREACANNSFPSLQMKLLKDLYQQDNLNFHCMEEGKSHIERCIKRSQQLSFLLVIDDIDHVQQLDALLMMDMLNISSDSLVIVITRDAGVLINVGITVSYNLKGMGTVEAEELFCWHAFRQPYPSSGFQKLVKRFVDLCCGLPLSLQVLGSHVHGTDQDFWELELEKVNKTLPRDIQDILKISVDKLDYEEKQIFMDLACFFIGKFKTNAIRVWQGSGWSAQHALQRLKNKCLFEEINPYGSRRRSISLREYTKAPRSQEQPEYAEEERFVLSMHDHLRDLGREMADELSHPRRLWRSQHLQSLDSKGFESILTRVKVRCSHSFQDPTTSFFIKFFVGESDSIVETSNALLWLDLNLAGQTVTSIPPWIPLQNLQSLTIRDGRLERLWQNNEQAPIALKELEIHNIDKLEELSLDLLRRLEVLAIHGCDDLKSATGISDFTKLVKLDIVRCGKLEELSLGRFNSVEKITIYDCCYLKSLRGISDLTRLEHLNIAYCGEFEELSLLRLSFLKEITIHYCDHLKSITGISEFTKLVKLDIVRCREFQELSFGRLNSVEKIIIHDCGHLKSLRGISDLTKLEHLNIAYCEELEELSLVQLNCLKEIIIHYCDHLKSVTEISDLTKLVKLDIVRCRELEELSLGRLNSVEIITIQDCGHFKSLRGTSDLKKMQDLSIGNCGELELSSLVQLSCIKQITIHNCGHLKRLGVISDLTKLEDLNIGNCGELQNLSLVRLSCLKEIRIHNCGQVQLSCIKQITIHNCGHLKRLGGISDLTKLEDLNIVNCGELQNLSLVRLSCLKEIRIHNCGHLKMMKTSDLTKLVKLDIIGCEELEELKIEKCDELEELRLVQFHCLVFHLNRNLPTLKRIEVKDCKSLITPYKLHLLERVQLLYCSNETIQNFILEMKKLPSEFIKVIGKAEDGAGSTHNANLFCDFINANSVIQIGMEHTCNHLGRHVLSAIVFCAVVVVNTCAAAKMINEFIGQCDINPWLKCEVRQGEWIITSVTTAEEEINSYLVNKGNCFPFDYLCFPEDVMVRSVSMPVMKGEEHKVLNVLRGIVDKLYQK